MAEWWQRRRLATLWWSLAVGLASALKWHFRAAGADDIGWMLQPLALLLRLVAGWHFQRTPAGEWASADAGIVLIKACAGINFMVLSFLGWCWLARPRGAASRGAAPRAAASPLLEWPALLGGALVLAWMTALLVNLLRIVAIVHLQRLLQEWLPAEQAHRAVGMAVFLPALGLQWLLCEPQRPGLALLAAGGAQCALLLLGAAAQRLRGAGPARLSRARAGAAGEHCCRSWRRAAGGGGAARAALRAGVAAERFGHRVEQRSRLVAGLLETRAGPQVGVREVGALQVGRIEAGIAERGAGEPRAVQHGAGEVGVLGGRAGEVRAGEVKPTSSRRSAPHATRARAASRRSGRCLPSGCPSGRHGSGHSGGTRVDEVLALNR
ncbi:MAG: exosortase K [Steroidobacteraceae bacterium]